MTLGELPSNGVVTVGATTGLDVGGCEEEEREDVVDDSSIGEHPNFIVDDDDFSSTFFSPCEEEDDDAAAAAVDAIRSFRSLSTSATTPGGIRLIISSRYSALALARFSTSLSFS